MLLGDAAVRLTVTLENSSEAWSMAGFAGECSG